MAGKHNRDVLEMLRSKFRAEDVVIVRETTPGLGGARLKNVEALVAEGFAEWIVPGHSARIKTTEDSTK